MPILLLLQVAELNWTNVFGQGVAFSLVVVFLIFILKALPTWKEIKLSEHTIRKEEAKVQVEMAKSLGGLATSVTQLSEVTRDISINSRRSVENVELMQRVSTEEMERLSDTMTTLIDTVDGLKKEKTQ